MPVLKTRKVLATLPAGALLSVTASDPASRIDMVHFCATSGHTLLSVDEAGGVLTFLIRREESG
jgi:tRNA 2-thiouridine synthesizing protein A